MPLAAPVFPHGRNWPGLERNARNSDWRGLRERCVSALNPRRSQAYGTFRSTLGRSILLGLEFLVAGDIVKSLVINPTLSDLVVLAGLVLVRTFLSISLGVEINGHWPWQDTAMARGRQTRSSVPARENDDGALAR
jgi:uncharacterized membrane protein